MLITVSKSLNKTSIHSFIQSIYRGFSGENPQKPPKFGDGDGARHCKSFKNTSGKGTAQNFGGYQMIFGESPKNPEIPMSIDWVQFFFSTL